jgi:hypothetical protein
MRRVAAGTGVLSVRAATHKSPAAKTEAAAGAQLAKPSGYDLANAAGKAEKTKFETANVAKA